MVFEAVDPARGQTLVARREGLGRMFRVVGTCYISRTVRDELEDAGQRGE